MEMKKNSKNTGHLLKIDGKEYSFKCTAEGEAEWVTLTKYAELFKMQSTNVITNWIRRKKIPAENILVIKEFNNLTLIKNLDYKNKS